MPALTSFILPPSFHLFFFHPSLRRTRPQIPGCVALLLRRSPCKAPHRLISDRTLAVLTLLLLFFFLVGWFVFRAFLMHSSEKISQYGQTNVRKFLCLLHCLQTITNMHDRVFFFFLSFHQWKLLVLQFICLNWFQLIQVKQKSSDYLFILVIKCNMSRLDNQLQCVTIWTGKKKSAPSSLICWIIKFAHKF